MGYGLKIKIKLIILKSILGDFQESIHIYILNLILVEKNNFGILIVILWIWKYFQVKKLDTDQLDKEKRKIEIKILGDKKIELITKTSFLENGIFYKVGGPDLKFNYYFTSTVNKLRLRDKPNLNGNFIKYLNKGDKLVILTSLEEVVEINGVKGTWVKVETEKGEIGWCFDAYLEPYNEVKKK